MSEIVHTINQMQSAEDLRNQEMLAHLKSEINYLIENDFEQLISILYRIDVNEEKIKGLLEHANGTGAADIIVEAIIGRQAEKIKTRKEFPTNFSGSEEEKW